VPNPEHVAKLKQGVDAWNTWRKREENQNVLPNFSYAYLRELRLPRTGSSGSRVRVRLSAADFHKADLRAADLRGADLRRAYLRSAFLREANLRGADLSGANFRCSNLFKADLSNTDLTGADLTAANLNYTDLTNARFGWTTLNRIDFSAAEVKGLESIRHSGPSSIDVETLYRSKGNIPPTFLHGCGVPETLIEYLPSLIASLEPIQFYSCFISYSHRDEDFARRLHARMEEEHLRVWYAPDDMRGGRKIHEQIFEAIRIYEKLLLVLSEHSMGSEWVRTEIRRARKRELAEKRQILFPIRLVDMDTIRAWECFDADSGKDLAVEIREYHIPDFSVWKDHDQFETAFALLRKDLMTEKKKSL
jgi:uncharacterized protein YjbI with pentapeptide repeats